MNPTATQTLYCPCCGQDRFTLTQFRPGASICTYCEALDPGAAVLQTRETIQREAAARTQTRDGRRAERVASRLAEYLAAGGKRCSECHARKPATPENFSACAARGDGFQTACRDCMRTRASLMRQAGGLGLWRAVRDTLRRKNEQASEG